MKIAFYSPLKPYDHKIASGDRNIARLLIKILKDSKNEIIIPSKFRSYSKHPNNQKNILELSINEKNNVHKILKDKKPDLWFTYHNYYKAPDYIGSFVSKKLSIPYIIAEASYAKKRENGEWKVGSDAAHESILSATSIINFTTRDREGIEKIFKKKLLNFILPPFPDTSIFTKIENSKEMLREKISKKYKIPKNLSWILSVGMMRDDFSKVSSYRILAETVKYINKEFVLLIVGSGPKLDYIKQQLYESIGKKVFFLGETNPPDLAEIYNSCDIFVWPGVNEAFGLAFLEAQACGLPVVGGNYGGISEVIQDSVTGFVSDVDENNIKSFANKINKILNNKFLREKMGNAGRNFIKQNRNLEKTAQNLNTIISLTTQDFKDKIND